MTDMHNDDELRAGAAAARAALLGLTTVIAIGLMLLAVNQGGKIISQVSDYIDGERE